MNKIELLKSLVNLAWADGDIHPAEKDFIFSLAHIHNIPLENVRELLKTRHNSQYPAQLNEDEKLEYLIHLLQLMKVDGKIYNSELQYCYKIAGIIGYSEEIVTELLVLTPNGDLNSEERLQLLKKAKEYTGV